MSKRYFYALAAIWMWVISPCAGEVKWIREDLRKAFEEAKKQQKFVMVDVVADWCAPCKLMDKTTWRDEAVIRAIDSLKLVPVKVDGDKPEGEKTLARYKIRGFPTLLFLDADGSELSRKVGFDPEADFVALIKAALKDTRPEKEIRAAIERDPSDAVSLSSLAARIMHMEDEVAMKERASLLARAYAADADNSKGVGAQAMVDRIAMAIPLLLQVVRARTNLDRLDQSGWLLGVAWGDRQDPQMPKRLSALKGSVVDIALSVERDIAAQLREAMAAAEKFQKPDANIEELLGPFMRPPGAPSPAPGIEDALYNFAASVTSSPEALNEIAFRNYSKQRELPAAEAMARKALAGAPGNTNIMDTLAHILFSVGKREEALKLQREAVSAAKREKSPNLEQLETSLKSLEEGKLDQLDAAPAPAAGIPLRAE